MVFQSRKLYLTIHLIRWLINPYKMSDLKSAYNSSNTCSDCLSHKDSLFSDLSAKELEVLDVKKYTASYNPGETICKEGTKPLGLICLKSGKAKMTKWHSNGHERIVGLKKAGDFIDLRALMVGNQCSSSTIALDECEVCIINKKDFLKVLKNHKFAIRIIQHLSNELIKKDCGLLNVTQKHMRSRLAETLLSIHNIYGVHPDSGMLNVSLKRAELAAIANMNVSNAIRILASFKKEKLIELSDRAIRIINPSALKKISLSNY